MASLPDRDDEKVVLVGHSYGGLGISLAMERFPEKISVGVFITAYMPNCQHPPATLIQEDLELAKTLVRPNGMFFDGQGITSNRSEIWVGESGLHSVQRRPTYET
ncbi:unnamed protein product [Camellia sinensis]